MARDTCPAMLMITSSSAPDSAPRLHQQALVHQHRRRGGRVVQADVAGGPSDARGWYAGIGRGPRSASGSAGSRRRIQSPRAGFGVERGLGHELRLPQGIRVALDVIHQLGNLLFGEQVEGEVARQVSESESNARICRSEEHTSELQSLTNLVCRL